MKYIGLNTQIWANNFKSVVLLILFPLVVFGLVWLFIYFIQPEPEYRIAYSNQTFLHIIPWVSIGIFLWFVIAFFSHSKMIESATGSSPLSRMENKQVYN